MFKIISGILIGVVLSAFILVTIALFFDTDIEWETLTTGFMALTGAWWTVNSIKKQINLEIDIINEEKKKKSFVLTSKLHLPLSDYIHYLKDLFPKNWNALSQYEIIDAKNRLTLINVISENIQYTDNQTVSFLRYFLENDQVLHARLKDNVSEGIHADTIITIVKLYIMAEDLLEYARGRLGELPQNLDKDRIKTRFRYLVSDIAQGDDGAYWADFEESENYKKISERIKKLGESLSIKQV